MWILVSEGVGYHNQSKHFLYTPNLGPPKNDTYSTGLVRNKIEISQLYTLALFS